MQAILFLFHSLIVEDIICELLQEKCKEIHNYQDSFDGFTKYIVFVTSYPHIL